MKPIDVIILSIAALLAVGLFVYTIIRKKQGKSHCPFCDGGGCGGNCSGCGVSLAPKAQESQENQENRAQCAPEPKKDGNGERNQEQTDEGKKK